MWQEYSRHVYARLGPANASSLRFQAHERGIASERAWDPAMLCMSQAVDELENVGWLPNQVRMWMASQWTIRHGNGWRDGEDMFFSRLLDGSRAANRLGWQWTVGAGTGKPYGFSRWQVEKRAPGLCHKCSLKKQCPIQQWPEEEQLPALEADPRLRRDDNSALTAGPSSVMLRGQARAVWITAESLGDADPALSANPELPVIFVFDEALLRRIAVHSPRLVFLAQALADLGQRRDVRIVRGQPEAVLSEPVATTFAPVPGWRRISRRVDIAEVHPWPWLVRPSHGPVTSFTAWSKSVGLRT